MPEPRWVVSMGSCANGGGYYHYSYSVRAPRQFLSSELLQVAISVVRLFELKWRSVERGGITVDVNGGVDSIHGSRFYCCFQSVRGVWVLVFCLHLAAVDTLFVAINARKRKTGCVCVCSCFADATLCRALAWASCFAPPLVICGDEKYGG